jgi:hypothetical protein
MSEPTPTTTSSTPPTAAAPATDSAWQDMMERLKRGEREMILAAVACALAVLQFLIGATGGALVTAAMLMNLALIGWLGNTAHARWRGGAGKGLMLLTGVAFALAAVSTLHLAQGITDIVTVAETMSDFGF